MKPETVTAYKCEQCSRLHDVHSDAEDCCLCKKCKAAPMDTSHGGRGPKCKACQRKENIRYAQERIRSLRSDLTGAEEHLARLKAGKDDA